MFEYSRSNNTLSDDSSFSHFMNALPFDIVNEIFSYLSQDDCIKSMAVCRTWYERVPIYSSYLWRKVEFLPGDQHTRLKNHRFLRCLGPHVRQAILTLSNKEELFVFLDTLLNQKCDIQSIVFRRCKVVHQDVYQEALRPFSNTLRELSFEDHPYRLSPIHMMASCPNLTHYTYQFSDRPDYYTYSRVASTFLPDTLQLPIKYLCLDTGSYSDFRLKSVLQHCPQLRCLIVNQSVPTTFDLDMCSRLCPELECLGFHDGVSQGAAKKWEAYARRCDTRRSRGLRHFISAEIGGYGARQMVPFLKKHQHTLKSIHIVGNNYRLYDEEDEVQNKSWSGIQSIHAQYLESIHLTGVMLRNESLGAFLRQSSQSLKRVVLDYEQMDFDDDVANALATLPQLRSLSIGVQKPEIMTTWAPNMTLLGFKRLLAAPNRLEEIALGGDVLVDDEIVEVLCGIRSLKSLELDHPECYNTTHLTADGLSTLATKNGKALESLTFRNVESLTDDTLLSLRASMGSLKRLELSGCSGVTDEALSAFVQNQTSIHELVIKDCMSISEDSIMELKNNRMNILYEP
ncbi:hypothetical protein BDA99DRAFT_563773 [Phascolomyces articulosus]|uniref:F-box domain-containing protein n=1 Tax=Phascolomyces articulosus TaxID=60185 RepID=A0AAD5P9Y8_9FUNG|nr:hypothetical protein BDA99DRAFT_563773 [Phascolomyces articulosus]